MKYSFMADAYERIEGTTKRLEMTDYLVEFLKENQSGFEAGMALNMGQLLSIPFVFAGIVFIARSFKPKAKK